MKGREGTPSPPPHSFINPTSKYVRTAYYTGSGGGGGMAQSAFKGAVSRDFFVFFLFFLSPSGTGKQKLQNKTEENPNQKNKNAPPGNPIYSIPK